MISTGKNLLLGGTRRAGLARGAIALLALVVLLLVDLGLSPYSKDVLTTLMIYVAGASAWNIVGGMAGQFSLAHSAFLGAGAYLTVMLLRNTGVPWLLALLAAGLASGVLAVLGAAMLVRQRAAYFTVGTMALTLLILAWMTVWEFTGGSQGIAAPIAAVPNRDELYAVSVVVAGVAVAAALASYYSGYGLRLMSIRDDEAVVDSMGIAPTTLKLQAMAISGVLTGFVGAVFALKNVSIEPFSTFSLEWSLSFIVMAIVGGLGTVWGPVVGAVIVYYGLTAQLRDYPAISQFVSAVLAVAIIKFFPSGIVGGISILMRKVLRERAARRSRDEVG